MAVSNDVLDRARARVGTTIGGKWALESVLGVGGMATVYAATHRNKSRAAVKMLHPEISIDASVRQRFLREGYVANTVNHPGTVRVLDDDVTADGAAYLVMELLVGETLETRRERKGGTLPPSEVLALLGQLLDVLSAAHGAGIVHRDLKPENLFLTDEGRLKVLDFGIARIRELSGATDASTQTGSLLGTPAFMAPEQALGRSEAVDHTTDLWAVGATAFTLLTDRCVHEATTVQEQLVFAATRHAPSIGTVMPNLAPPVVALVDKSLAFEKAARFQSAQEMREALRLALSDALPNGPVSLLIGASTRPVSSRPPSPTAETLSTGRPHVVDAEPAATASTPVPRRSPWLIGAGVAAVLALGVGAFLLGRTGRTDAPTAGAASTAPEAHTTPQVDAVRPPASATPPAASASVEVAPVPDSAPKPSASVKSPKKPPVDPPPTTTKVPPGGNPFDKRF